MPQARPEGARSRRRTLTYIERGLKNGGIMRNLAMRKTSWLPSLTIIAAIAIWSAACSSKTAEPTQPDLASMQISPAAVGSCQIDAIKMCQATDGSGKAAQPAASAPENMPMSGSYGPPNMPDSVEFQIPAGQTIKRMCYFDHQQ